MSIMYASACIILFSHLINYVLISAPSQLTILHIHVKNELRIHISYIMYVHVLYVCVATVQFHTVALHGATLL